jgi:predicted nucleic acid-binding protein
VSDEWVLDASPLILFARIARLDLFEQLSPRIIVPIAVLEEVRAGQAKDGTAALALAWSAERRVPNVVIPASIEHWDLGRGESQVLSYALDGGRWVVLDDLAARRCAASYGLAVIGSLGVVLRAKQRGLLAEARPWITKLMGAGMFVDDSLLNSALNSVGE